MADRKRKRKRHAAGPGGARTSADPARPNARPTAAPKAPGRASAGGGAAMRRGYAKAEEKNVAAREALQPIGPENRPRIVLVACAWLLLACVSLVVSFVTADGDDASTQRAGNALFLLIVLVAIWGTWRLRPWAMLGAQTLFALAFVFTCLAAVFSDRLLLSLALGLSALVTGAIFYKMINVMARVQKMELQRRGSIPGPGSGDGA